jgi:hypothetical protein
MIVRGKEQEEAFMRRGFATALAVLVAGALTVGWGRATLAQDGTPVPPTEFAITLNAVDFAFEGPSEAPAGLITVTMTNNGAESHHAQLVKLNDGVTLDQFQAALQSGDEAAMFPLVTFVGGPGAIGPGGVSQVVLRLGAGTYVALCFISGEDGIPHLAKGMVFPFTLTGEDAGEPDPTADAEVTLVDYGFEMPASVAAGPQVWKVTNTGAEPHELTVLKLAPGLTVDDFMAMMMASEASPEAEMEMASPAAGGEMAGPPVTEVGGMQALGNGLSGWLVLDLEPGEYVAICFVSDPTGVPHAFLGMVAGFTVA